MIYNKGFSLIELLIVVAIIGVLAAAGVVGYQSYTETAKNNVLDNNMANTFKAAKTDIEALTQGLTDTSELFDGADVNSDGEVSCQEAAVNMVEYLNINYSNPHDASRNVAAYGNGSVIDNAGTFMSSDPDIASMNRQGIIFVSCNDPSADIRITDASKQYLNPDNDTIVKLYQCGCETTDCTFTATSDFDDPTVCPAPREDAGAPSGGPFYGGVN